ncbi:MAG: protein kinase domain-containing protein [Planctomycetota bacterium]
MESQLPAGHVVANYRILSKLGSGGMGIVYEAEELDSGRRVALKILQSDLRHSEEALERFRREAESAAAISHHNCVFLFGVTEIEGAPAIAMELVDGETVEERITKSKQPPASPIPIAAAAGWMLQILDGLGAAHRAGVIHRDVKPSNCFITNDGTVKIGDFGLSRLLEPDIQLTQSGQFVGSPLFAAPEQIKGDVVTPATDVYSAGATLFTILAGRPPFEGQNIGAVLARILGDPPPSVRSLRPDVPAGIDKILQKALAKNPRDRFQSMQQMRRALEPFAGDRTTVAALGRRVGGFVLDQGIIMLLFWTFVVPLLSFFNISALGASSDPVNAPAGDVIATFAASFIIAILYFGFCEWRFGATAGKWLLAQRVVDLENRPPRAWRIAVRSLVFHALIITFTLGVLFISGGSKQTITVSLAPWFSMMGYIVVNVSMRKSNAFRGIHELASGTRVVESATRQSGETTVPLPELKPLPAPAAGAGPWKILGLLSQTPGGPLYLAHDSKLKRNLWLFVHTRTGDAPPVPPPGPHDVRWLGRAAIDGVIHDSFEAVAGSPASEYLERPRAFPWTTALSIARSAVDLAGAISQDTDPRRLWITTRGEVRIAPCAVGVAGTDAQPASSPRDTLLQLATVVLFGNAKATGHGVGDAPIMAMERVRAALDLQGSGALGAAASAIRESAGAAYEVRRGVRMLQMFMGNVLLLFSFFVMLPMVYAVIGQVPGFIVVAQEIKHPLRVDSAPANFASSGISIKELRDARLTIIRYCDYGTTFRMTLRGSLGANNIEIHEALPLLEEARDRFPNVSREDYARAISTIEQSMRVAEETLASRAASRLAASAASRAHQETPVSTGLTDEQRVIKHARLSRPIPIWFMCTVLFSILAGVNALLSAATRGGISMFAFGLRVRWRSGAQAHFGHILLRESIGVLPVAGILYLASKLESGEYTNWSHAVGLLGICLYIGGGLIALRTPSRGISDRILGTRIVVR